MDNNNLADKISELLADPEGMERIQSMAQSLLGESTQPKEETPQLDLSGLELTRVLSALKNNQVDDRSRLLLALRPHLSSARRERVDKAVKLLRLVSVMPLLKESGILNDIF